MTQTPKELEQNLDWLKSHYYALLHRVEELERQKLTVAVSPSVGFGTQTKELTGEGL